MGYPKVSILTPTYNHARFIEETILSVKGQDYPSLEHVIIDGGSTDGTLAILRKYPHLVWQSVPHLAQTPALNKAISISTGEIIGWINSDDRYLPGAVGTGVDFLVRNPDVDLVYGDLDFIDAHGRFVYRRREMGPDYLTFLYVHTYIWHCAAFFRRRVFEKTGLLDEDVRCCMDYEFILRMMKASSVLRHIPRVMCEMRLYKERKTVREREWLSREARSVQRRYQPRFSTNRYLDRLCNEAFGLIVRSKRIFTRAVSGHYFEPGYIAFIVKLLLGRRI